VLSKFNKFLFPALELANMTISLSAQNGN